VIRIDVDFNARDDAGHVVARLPAAQLDQLSVDQHVYLYDPVDRLWAEASVAQLESDISVGTFDVDWNSFVDGELFVEDAWGRYVLFFVLGRPAGTEWILHSRSASGTGRPTEVATGSWAVSTK
jgi:hypothetical protein